MMQDCQANTVNLWLSEYNFPVKDNYPGDNFITPTIELKFMEAFCEFPYLTKGQLMEFSENFGLPLTQILCWFNNRRLHYNISWSPLEIDYAKSIIRKYDEKQKQNNGDSLKKVALDNGNETTDMSSMESAASNSQAKDLNFASSSGNLVDIFILFIYV